MPVPACASLLLFARLGKLHVDEANIDEKSGLEKLNVLIREHIPIANLNLYKPTQVVGKLNQRVPFEISVSTHTSAWKYYSVRPPYGASHPERTKVEFCIYDEVHKDYLYTQAWIERLVEDLSSSALDR